MMCSWQTWTILIVSIILVSSSVGTGASSEEGSSSLVNLANLIIFGAAIAIVVFSSQKKYNSAATACKVVFYAAIIIAVLNLIYVVVASVALSALDTPELDDLGATAYRLVIAVLVSAFFIQLLFVWLSHSAFKCFEKASIGQMTQMLSTYSPIMS